MLRRLAADSIVYGLAIGVTRLLQFLLLPVYTRLFGAQDYGVLSLAVAVMAFLNILVVLSLDTAVGRWYWISDDDAGRRRVIASWFWCQTLVAVLLAGALALLAAPLVEWLRWDPRLAAILPVAALSLPVVVASVVLSTWLRLVRRPWVLLAVTVSGAVLSVSAVLLFVAGFHQGIAGVYRAQLLANLVMLAIAAWILRAWIAPRHFSRRILREMLGFALPLVPAAIALAVVAAADRFVLQAYRGAAEVGIYQLAGTIALAIGLLTMAFQQAWGPFAMSIHRTPEAPAIYARVMFVYGAATAWICVLLAWLAPDLVWLLATPEFAPAARLVGMLALAQACTGMGYIAVIGLTIVRGSVAMGMAYLSAAIVNVAMNLALVPHFGAPAAALAFLAAQATVPLFLFWQGHRVYPLPFPFLLVGSLYALALAAILGLGLLPPAPGGPGILAAKIVVAGVLAALCWRWGRPWYTRRFPDAPPAGGA